MTPHRVFAAAGLAAGLAVTLPLAACQSTGAGGPAVSVDEAKRITANLGGASFRPPPKKATDVLALLEQDWLEGERRLAGKRTLADSAPPAGLDATGLARFYSRRARAADLLGRAGQKIDDFLKAIEYADKADTVGIIERVWLYGNYSQALLYGGDPVKARDIFAAVLDEIPFNVEIESWGEGLLQGHSIAWFGMLAAIHGFLGDLEVAEEAMDRVSRVNTASQGWPVGPQERGIFAEMTASARATVLDLLGRFPEAEIEHRKALKAIAPFREWRLWTGVTYEQLESEQQWRRTSLAANLGRQGRLLEAETEARSALQAALRTEGRDSIHTHAMLQTLAGIFLAQGRFAEAERLTRATLGSLGKVGATPTSLFFIKARIRLAETLAAQSRWAEAASEFTGVETDLAARPRIFRALLDGNVDWGLSLLRLGRVDAAPARTPWPGSRPPFRSSSPSPPGARAKPPASPPARRA